MTNARNLSNRATDFISIMDFIPGNVDPGSTATDCSPYILAAIAATGNYHGQAKGIFFPGRFYNCQTAIPITLSAGRNLTFYCDTKATLVCSQPAGTYLIDVDYVTGATANFTQFNMTGMMIADAYNRTTRTRNGMRIKGSIGSKFTQCEFNWLNIAVDMYQDTHMNTFDTCMWRENNTAWRSSDGVANNNMFLNCTFRYHYATAFDSTGTDGNIIDGGDFEPLNVTPAIIANNLIMRNVRFERNVASGTAGITVLTGNNLDVRCYADAATSADPLFNVTGDRNVLRVSGTGSKAAIIRAGTKKNIVEVGWFRNLLGPASATYYCEDSEKSNLLKVGGSVFSNSITVPPVEVFKDELIPADLTTWTATNCSVSSLGNGGYRVTMSGTGASLSYTPPAGTYSELHIGLTAPPSSHAASQPTMTITGGPATTFGVGNGFPGYTARKVCSTLYTASYVNPTFTLAPTLPASAGAGTYFDIYNLRTSQLYFPE